MTWTGTPPTRRWSRSSRRPSAISAAGEALGQVCVDLVQADPLLAHAVPVPDGDRVVVERVEVHRDAERRADLVLPPVPAADRAGVVELRGPPLAHHGGEIAGLRRQVGVAGQ